MPKSIFTPLKKIIPGINLSGLKSVDEAQARVHESRKLIRTNGLFECPTGRPIFADYLKSVYGYILCNPEIKEKMSGLFKGQVIADLGAGRQSHGYALAQLVGARAYVGVEPFFPKLLETSVIKEDIPKEIPIAIAPEDMLSFLKRLPDNSISIILSGIDDIILPRAEYRGSVKNEIMRTLDPKGAILYNSNFCLLFNLQRSTLEGDKVIDIYTKHIHNHETKSSRIKIQTGAK